MSATAFANTTGSRLGCGEPPFELGYADGTWAVVASAVVDGPGRAVTLVAADAARGAPTEVRYAWANFPQCALYSGAGDYASLDALPAAPFRFALGDACGSTQSMCAIGAAPFAGAAQCCADGAEVCAEGAGCMGAPVAG